MSSSLPASVAVAPTAAPPSPLRAVLIDLDGTLLDTAPDLADAANAVRAHFGLAPLDVARVAQFIGKGADILVQRALTDTLDGRLAAADYNRAKAVFEQRYGQINGRYARVFDGVSEGLRLLRAAGLRLACVTNKSAQFAAPLLHSTGLRASFDTVVAGDEVAQRKPHPDLVLEACRRLGVAPAAVLLIGDSVNDAQAAHAAGAVSVLLETGYNEGVPVTDLGTTPGVRAVVPTLLEAARWMLAGLPVGLPAERVP